MGGGLSSARLGNSISIDSSDSIILESQSVNKSGTVAIVYDIIIDDSHPLATNSSLIGAIKFRKKNNIITDVSQLPIAYPFDKNFKNIPIINESVEIHESSPGLYFYKRITQESNPTISAVTNAISYNFPEKKENTNQSKEYQQTLDTNIPKTNKSNSSLYNGFGKYYQSQPNIHKLKLYEGDSLIESRFGQSIRFSGFNNAKNKFSPTIIIRNRESSNNIKLGETQSVEEDVNSDGTIIALTSGEYQLGFIPGTVDDKGKGDFKTKPESFEDYPSKLIGDQLLLNSGRIILSAKSGEMIFYSKKNYGFISDGSMSIDNQGGIDISVGDNINIITNDRDINFVTGNGTMFFGSQDLEPMVKGQQLVDILSELIDTIGAMQFLTPSGPSAIGPVNSPDFGKVKSKLNSILSQRTQLS